MLNFVHLIGIRRDKIIIGTILGIVTACKAPNLPATAAEQCLTHAVLDSIRYRPYHSTTFWTENPALVSPDSVVLPQLDTCATKAAHSLLKLSTQSTVQLVNRRVSGPVQLITLLANGDDYSTLVLATFRNQRLIATLPLSGGFFPGYDFNEEPFHHRIHIRTQVLNDSTLVKTSVAIISQHIPAGPHTVDSVRLLYRIHSTGKISELSRDSIRLIRTGFIYP